MIQCCYNMVINSIIVLTLHCIHVVYILYLRCTHSFSTLYLRCMCIACALLNIGDAMLQQHTYKLNIQYWLNVVFLLLMLPYICYNHIFPTLYLYCLCVVEGRWCNVATTELQIRYSIVNQCCIHVYYDVVNVL
jgi:hypothetical protein